MVQTLQCDGGGGAVQQPAEAEEHKQDEVIGVHWYGWVVTRSGHGGHVEGGAVRWSRGVLPRRRRARLREADAMCKPQPALAEALAHYGVRERFELSTCEEDYGCQARLTIWSYCERYIGPVRCNQLQAEDATCRFVLQHYRDQGYIDWL